MVKRRSDHTKITFVDKFCLRSMQWCWMRASERQRGRWSRKTERRGVGRKRCDKTEWSPTTDWRTTRRDWYALSWLHTNRRVTCIGESRVQEMRFVSELGLHDNFVSWEQEGHCHYRTMFRWEPEGRYRTKYFAIAPFWFSIEHWTKRTLYNRFWKVSGH